jgi:hypothetical protein
MASARGDGLEDVIDLALDRWAPRSARLFGAAGPRGSYMDVDMFSLVSASQAPREAAVDPFSGPDAALDRLFMTGVGQRAIARAPDYPSALRAIERLSIEVIAEAVRLTRQVNPEDRLLVMQGRPNTPPVLMVMSPQILNVQESRVISDEQHLPLPLLIQAANDAVSPDEITPELDAFIARLVLSSGPLELAEIFMISQPEVVRTRRPKMIRLCVPSPHIEVDFGGTISTAGVFCRDAAGRLGVTACYHGTGPVGTEVTVDLKHGSVARASEVQDIVFIPLDHGFNVPEMAGLGGVAVTREPARSAHVHFDGATNQNRTTRILSSDAGLLRPRPSIMLKLQTDPDTDQGDSGSALLDEDDTVLGFAFERTSYDDHPQFTDWIWAANALRALELVAYRE